MEQRHYWEENGHVVKYDNFNSNDGFGRANGELNFAAAPSEDEAEYPPGAYLKKGKVSRQDPMSHRIIEKRRRDRMNNCLADLSRLIPPEYLKKGRGRVEKTEIIEMAIRHLKYLQERVNAAERQGDEFRAGYQEAVAEAVRYLVDVQGCQPADRICVQMTTHLHRHCEHVVKGIPREALPREKQPPPRTHGSSSETTSSSSSSHGYMVKNSVIAQAPAPAPLAPPFPAEPYEPKLAPEQPYQAMDCDRESGGQLSAETEVSEPLEEPLPLDARIKHESTLRNVRKQDHDDYLQSYKFKNSIERRFSRSQDNERNRQLYVRVEAWRRADVNANSGHTSTSPDSTALAVVTHPQIPEPPRLPQGKVYSHKRRRAAKPAPSTSTSNSGSTEEARDTSPQDTSSDSPHNHHYEKPAPPTQYVPVFALNAHGKYYVPLSVDSACLSRHLGPYDVLDARAMHMASPLHPVTIHVNFQPCLNYHLKREPADREWRAA